MIVLRYASPYVSIGGTLDATKKEKKKRKRRDRHRMVVLRYASTFCQLEEEKLDMGGTISESYMRGTLG